MDRATAGDDLIHELSRIIQTIKDMNPQPTAQVYTWSSEEIDTINDLIVYKALGATSLCEDIRQCIGTLLDLPSLLQTNVQPSLFGDSRNSVFWRERDNTQLESSFDQLNLGSDQPKLRKLPGVVALHPAAREVLALPGPGYNTMESWATYLEIESVVPPVEEMYVSARDQKTDLDQLLASQSKSVHEILLALRRRVGLQNLRVFINSSLQFRPQYKPACRDERLRKLVFMQEVGLVSVPF